jgi:hypothetical protein
VDTSAGLGASGRGVEYAGSSSSSSSSVVNSFPDLEKVEEGKFSLLEAAKVFLPPVKSIADSLQHLVKQSTVTNVHADRAVTAMGCYPSNVQFAQAIGLMSSLVRALSLSISPSCTAAFHPSKPTSTCTTMHPSPLHLLIPSSALFCCYKVKATEAAGANMPFKRLSSAISSDMVFRKQALVNGVSLVSFI